MKFYILFLFTIGVRSLFIFPKFKHVFFYNTTLRHDTHFWETKYGYNVLECSEIKKFDKMSTDKMSIEMICSLF